MAVLVIGGSGYIGSHAARTLRRHGYDVLIMDNLTTGHRFLADGFELIEANFGDRAVLEKVLPRVDAVMHFAALAAVGESVVNPRKYFQNNVEAAVTLLNTMLDCGVKRLVFSSTCAVYGLPPVIPIAEDTPRNPVNPYGVTKMIFEYALESYATAYGLSYASLRYFNAAGADESGEIGELHIPENHLIPAAFEAALGMRPELNVFGEDYPTPDGTCIRDYIHVNDLAEAHVTALRQLEAGSAPITLNLGTGVGNSVKEVIEAVERVTGLPVPRKVGPRRAGDPPALVADPRKAEAQLGWKAQRSLEQVVETAWKWMQHARAKGYYQQ